MSRNVLRRVFYDNSVVALNDHVDDGIHASHHADNHSRQMLFSLRNAVIGAPVTG